ncbi:unnamed protein product [Closterium sp. Yama58-4]|nr:unnamed protein product [Closterium sp. Yama58-4]
MRGILMDWLVEVAEEYRLVPDTLFLTAAYIDRFLSHAQVTKNHLQLLGIAAMLIASKYEEIYAPQVDEFCYITDNTYRRHEKPLNRYFYIPFSSFHSRECKKGFISSELKRHCIRNSSFNTFWERKVLFFNRLKARGYPDYFLRPIFNQVKFQDRHNLLRSCRDKLKREAPQSWKVIDMEWRVLLQLNFVLATPTTKSFLRRFIRAAQVTLQAPSLQLEFLGNFLAELTLLDCACVAFLPSQVAAAAVFLAKLTLFPSLPPWTPTLQHYTGYSVCELEQAVWVLHALHVAVPSTTLPAIGAKYSQAKSPLLSSQLLSHHLLPPPDSSSHLPSSHPPPRTPLLTPSSSHLPSSHPSPRTSLPRTLLLAPPSSHPPHTLLLASPSLTAAIVCYLPPDSSHTCLHLLTSYCPFRSLSLLPPAASLPSNRWKVMG